MWSSGWVRLLGAITDVPGDILCGSHHRPWVFIYTYNYILWRLSKWPSTKALFLLDLTARSRSMYLLARLLGSNNSNSKVTPLQTPLASSFILTLTKEYDQILKAIRFILRLDYSSCWCTTISFSISRLFYNCIFLYMLQILLFTLVEHLARV